MTKGKAENLAILAGIRGINVPKFITLRPDILEDECMDTIRAFISSVSTPTFAVRSSAANEDSADASFAGMYSTKLHVSANVADVMSAVHEVRDSGSTKQEVISHYATQRNVELADVGISVIVQEMINADTSGVIFSHDLIKRDGYYVVSVSKGIGETIVGGAANGTLIRIARGVKLKSVKEAWIKKVVSAMRIIERHFQSSSLDVEFAIRNGSLYILQCRPITTIQMVMDTVSEKKLKKDIDSLNASIALRFGGDVLGDMIDINPLELLGAKPTSLDVSIFQYLFADKIVERVRRDMGYDPLDIGLVRVVAGKPYTSMRATAFSFRPLGIPDRIYECMVSVYRDALIEHPALQSRVEFDLYAMSCGDKLEQIMSKAQLNDDDKHIVRDAFTQIDFTFRNVSQSCADSFEVNAREYEQRTMFLEDALTSMVLEHVAVGTEMFVRIARLAFYWKNKFEEMYPEENLNNLITGHIQSVNGQLQADLVACRNGVLNRGDLVRQYGHLRPGQFSVFGESYADDPDTYLFGQMQQAEVVETSRRTHEFENATEFKNVIVFMQARERMKFLFSRSLHLFSTKLKYQLAQRGISESDASRVSWDELNGYLCGSSSFWMSCGEDDSPVLLPDVIIPEITDLEVIMFSEAMPSYITNSIVKARVCVLERLGVKADVRGALVLLPNADPGYDFLFHSGAVGIITKVGGPASHMCIRSIELQMPACIGCGESVYQKIASANAVVLDCNSKQIVVL